MTENLTLVLVPSAVVTLGLTVLGFLTTRLINQIDDKLNQLGDKIDALGEQIGNHAVQIAAQEVRIQALENETARTRDRLHDLGDMVYALGFSKRKTDQEPDE